jgi:hypothetical protein
VTARYRITVLGAGAEGLIAAVEFIHGTETKSADCALSQDHFFGLLYIMDAL